MHLGARSCLAATAAILALSCGAPGPKEIHRPRPGGYPQPGHLLPLFSLDNPRLRETAALMAKAGNEQEKRVAGARLVLLAEEVGTDAWRESQRQMVARLHPQAFITEASARLHLAAWQQRHLVRLYDAMEQLGGEPVLVHCRKVAGDDRYEAAHRQLAVSVLAAHGQAKKGPAPQPGQPWAMPGAPPAMGPPPATTFAGPPSGAAPVTPRADAPTVSGGDIANLEHAVDALRPHFKGCYLQALQQYGRFGSWIILRADVGSGGRVMGVAASGDDSSPYSMIQCLRNVVLHAQFSPPSGGRALVSIPLAFTTK